jgi:hypothetical protein
MPEPYQYNPTGALNGLFAPAYIAGNPQAEAAASAWNAARAPAGAPATPAGGSLFAPPYVAGNPQSAVAVSAWNAANLKTPPPAVAVPPPVSNSGGIDNRRRDLVARAIIMRQGF